MGKKISHNTEVKIRKHIIKTMYNVTKTCKDIYKKKLFK